VKKQSANIDTTLQNGIQVLDAIEIPFSLVCPSAMVEQIKKQMRAMHFAAIRRGIHLLWMQENVFSDTPGLLIN
jgi:hypothetical protein